MASKTKLQPSDIPEIPSDNPEITASKSFENALMEPREEAPELGPAVNSFESNFQAPDGTEMPNGDVLVQVLLREQFVQVFRDEARLQAQTLCKHVQGLMDWWVEQEFSQIVRK